MVTLTEIEELSVKIDKLVNLTEIEELSLRVDTLVLALDDISKELGDFQSKQSPELLSRWKRFLTTKSKLLLLLEHKIYVSESIDEDWKSNSFDSFELVGSVMKKVELIVKVIDEKLEAATVDSSSSSNFTQQSSNPPVPDASDGVLGSSPTMDYSNISGESESKVLKDKIDGDLKSISLDSSSVDDCFQNSSTLTATDKGNFLSTPIIAFPSMVGSCTVIKVQKYNGNSSFLAYQEGKPFISDNKILDVAEEFQVSKVIDSEVKNLNPLNQNYNTDLQQFVDRKLIRGPNLNGFLTSDLNSFTSTNFVTNFNSSVKFVPVFSYYSNVIKDLLVQPTIRSTSLCDTISGFNCIHKLFDRGKLFENMFWSSLLKSSDVDCSNFCQHHIYTGVIYFWLIHMCANRGKCSYCVLIFAGRVIDRGKWLELISFSANFISEMNSELGYHLELLIEYSNVFELIKKGYQRIVSKLFEEKPRQNNALCTISRSYATMKYKYENAGGLIFQILFSSRGSLKVNVGNLMLQLRYCLHTIGFTKVYFFIYIVLITSICAGLSDAKYTRLLFDRGKGTEPGPGSSSHDRNISKFCTASCLFICNGLFFLDAYDLSLELVHHLGWLFGISNVFLFITNGGSLAACELFDETVQQGHVLCTNFRLHMERENKSSNAQGISYQLLVEDNSPIQMKEALQKFKKMETLSPVSVTLLVCTLIIQKEYHCWFFSSQFGFNVFFLGLWSMGNDNDYALIVTKLQLGTPCCIGFHILIWCLSWRESLVRVVGIMEMLVLFKSGNYKGASGVIDGTLQGKVGLGLIKGSTIGTRKL